MPGQFKRFLCVSTQASRLSREEFLLDRISWRELSVLKNLSDYDEIYLNLTALAEAVRQTSLGYHDLIDVFDVESWADVLAASGCIFLVGDPHWQAGQDLGNDLLGSAVILAKDDRPVDYRRVEKRDWGLFPYLDSVNQWNFSWKGMIVTEPFGRVLAKKKTQFSHLQRFGLTPYGTWLAGELCFKEVGSTRQKGRVVVLPPLGKGPEAEDHFILQTCFGIASMLEAPDWTRKFVLPGQSEIEKGLSNRQQDLRRLEKEIAAEEAKLQRDKRWHRLLYDDGDSLELIVKEALEALGAGVTKVSKVKDDFRVQVGGHPQAVVEIKGTHNSKFGIGALRQLAGWVDEAMADHPVKVKGIFVGNGARTAEPQTRAQLFEKGAEDFAKLKEFAIIRTVDLYCLTILKQLNRLDLADFWNELFNCKGSFDATRFWHDLPKEFNPPGRPAP